MWGTRRATNKQVHQQAPITSFKTQLIQYTKYYKKKTVNTKLGKQTIWFSEVNKDIYQYFQKNKLEDEKDRKESCIAFLKLINRYYKIIWLKSTSIFEEQTRIPLKLNIEKNCCRQKKQQLSNSCRFQSIQRWSRREKPFPNKKPQNQSIRGQITLGIQLQTFPSKCNTRTLQSKTWNTAQKTHSNNGGNHTS